MRICLMCVYWTLLFISVASSALLFIIVASESAQTNYYSTLKTNQTLEAYDNELDSRERDDLELSNIAIVKMQDPTKLATKYKDNYYQDKFAKESTNFETVIDAERGSKNPYGDPDVVAESLTSQPNLSQGMSESGEAAVLSLVGTTTTELQGLEEPRFSPEFTRARLFVNDSSSLTKNVNIQQETIKDHQEISPSTEVPSLPNIGEIAEESNQSNVLEEEPLLLQNIIETDAAEFEEVVVVRAEQSPIMTDESEFNVEEKLAKVLPDGMPKIEEFLTTTPEFSDTEGKLVGHTRDEATEAVFTDGIVPVGSTDPHEEIPSFNEWTQKRLEEAEKKKMHPNASVQNSGAPPRGAGGMKVRSKNYASPDCGAKIVAANPEARSARSVLVATRDEYMLNTCTSRIWFVVELCEAIQAKKIELANFELFSSSPKDFSVYISDRFPTRDWSLVGQFTAKDVKDTQSFVLQPQLFGKFIKVELHTYYGSEHFCPISLFRAYGTSEFEVLETETESQISRNTNANVNDDDDEDSDEEEVLDVENGEPPRNLFGSARDAVLSIVKKAAEVLVKSSELTGNNITKIQQSIDSANILENSFVTCTTPRYTILCDNCSDQKFARIFQLVSCREQQLNKWLKIDIVNRTLQQSGFCSSYGVKIEASTKRDTQQERENRKDRIKKYRQTGRNISSMNFQLTFLTSVLKPEYIAALCNVLAIKERKMVMNTSYDVLPGSCKDTDKVDKSHKSNEDYSNEAVNSFQHTPLSSAPSSSTENLQSAPLPELQQGTHGVLKEEVEKVSDTSIESSLNLETLASQIKPTKALDGDDARNDSSTLTLKSSKDSNEESAQVEVLTTTPGPLHTEQHPVFKVSEETLTTSDVPSENSHQTTVATPVVPIDNNEFLHKDIVPDADTLEFSGTQTKMEKADRIDQEERHKQTEILDQEIKLSSQDSLAFDSLLSDLKDLEGESIHIHNGPAANPSVAHSTANMPQKESVFLRLSNRIKALERNMSLSGQYLEELSRRYKKQVEEMQRSLERTVSAMHEETRKWEEHEYKRAEEIAMLREDIATLSRSVKGLLHDRDSWHGKLLMIGQHFLLICSEIFVIFLILLYCRGTRKSQEKRKQQLQKDTTRRKSAEHFGSHIKKTKKRRPSEIASNISGTYHDLMIDDKSCEIRKGRKKKRKKEGTNKTNVNNNDIKRNVILHSRSASNVPADNVDVVSKKFSSVEVLQASNSQSLICKRPKSAPENTIDWFDNCISEREYNVQLMLSSNENFEMESVQCSDFSSSCSENRTKPNSLPLSKSVNKIDLNEQSATELGMDTLSSKNSNQSLGDTKPHPSSFIKTALSARKKRKFQLYDVNGKSNNSVEQKQHLNYPDDTSVGANPATSELYSEAVHSNNSTSSGTLVDQSDESRCTDDTSVSKRKYRKNTAFRKMSRR